MDFSEQIEPMIESDAEGNMSFELVRGGSLILTDKNTYIIEENILGELESFEKIRNEEINSIRVQKQDDLTSILDAPVGSELIDEYEENYDENGLTDESLQELVQETDVDPTLLSRVLDRDKPATLFRVHLNKRAPTIHVNPHPDRFVRKFLASEVYRENYVGDNSEGI